VGDPRAERTPSLAFFADAGNRNAYGWGDESAEELQAFYRRDAEAKKRLWLRENPPSAEALNGVLARLEDKSAGEDKAEGTEALSEGERVVLNREIAVVQELLAAANEIQLGGDL
jgi:hypothetical protein